MRTLPILLLLPIALQGQTPLPTLLPLPVHMERTAGELDLKGAWQWKAPDAAIWKDVAKELGKLLPPPSATSAPAYRISVERTVEDTLRPAEWYTLQVDPKGIRLSAPTEAGLYRGSRSLVQLLEQGVAQGALPGLLIQDHPRFAWRGAHLDVVRHYFPVPFIKRYIDLLARYRLNSFHWHLTDDQGWRFPVDSYPELTRVAAWRRGSQVGPYSDQRFDTLRYGGQYTKAEIREVVAYAAARHINVVPEIELPGHAMAALAAYPALGCTGGPYEVQRGWGVFDDVFCAGNDSVMTFLSAVIAEVVELFPSPYIHIGGDECPKTRWEACPKCQARMREQGLKDSHELQSWFIREAERMVNAHGRRIIGWDEILEGGLAPDATVMSWRGEGGGISAARSGHDAVMTPQSHCYFDHYQGDPVHEPLAFGGFTPLRKVYAYEPVPAELEPEHAQHILGAQANLWTEYITTEAQVEYMLLPRLLALAEVLWSPASLRNEADFLARTEKETVRLIALGHRVSNSVLQTRITPRQGPRPGSMALDLTADMPDRALRYRMVPTDGKGATEGAVTGPVVITRDAEVQAWVEDAAGTGPRSTRNFHFNMATARPVTLSTPPHERYALGGAFTLVDGIEGSSWRNSKEWLAWQGPVTITVDLGEERKVGSIAIAAVHAPESWIHAPLRMEFRVTDNPDGPGSWTAERPVGVGPDATPGPGRQVYSCALPARGRYVQVRAVHGGPIPAELPGAGNPAWLFLDEVIVR